jgi:hypothetical protein
MEFEVVGDAPPIQVYGRKTPIDWDGAKQALLDNEGKWVKMVENCSSSHLQALRKGANPRFRGEELDNFEFLTRRPQRVEGEEPYRTGFSDLYGKYTKPRA